VVSTRTHRAENLQARRKQGRALTHDETHSHALAENARWHSLCPRGVGKTLAVEAFVKKYIEIKEAVRHRGPRGGPRHPFTPLEDFALVCGILEQGPAAYEDTQVRGRRLRSCGFPRHEPSLFNCSTNPLCSTAAPVLGHLL